jgi:hypothetical protein
MIQTAEHKHEFESFEFGDRSKGGEWLELINTNRNLMTT